MFYKKEYSKIFYSFKGVLCYLVWTINDIIVWYLTFWLLTKYLVPLTPDLAMKIVLIIPVPMTFITHYYTFMMLNKLILFAPIKLKFSEKHKAMVGILLLIFQLLVSVYLGISHDKMYEIQPYIAPLVCMVYPLIIGSIKAIQLKMILAYDVEIIYEFLSLNLASLPYRFLYLNIDLPIIAAGVLIIKFSYKIFFYVIMFIPCIYHWKTKILRKYKSSPVEAIKETDNEENLDKSNDFDESNGNILKRENSIMLPNIQRPSVSFIAGFEEHNQLQNDNTVFENKKLEDDIKSIQDHDEPKLINSSDTNPQAGIENKIDDSSRKISDWNKLSHGRSDHSVESSDIDIKVKAHLDEKLWRDVSYKFFFQQTFDIGDAIGALIIIVLLRTLEKPPLKEKEHSQYQLLFWEVIIECILELIFTMLARPIIRKVTVLSDFSPSKYAKCVLKKNLIYFSLLSIITYPLLLFIVINLNK